LQIVLVQNQKEAEEGTCLGQKMSQTFAQAILNFLCGVAWRQTLKPDRLQQ